MQWNYRYHLLLIHVVSPIFPVQDGDTALHIAVRCGLLDSVEALLQCSADLGIRNKVSKNGILIILSRSVQCGYQIKCSEVYSLWDYGIIIVKGFSYGTSFKHLLSPKTSVLCKNMKFNLLKDWHLANLSSLG